MRKRAELLHRDDGTVPTIVPETRQNSVSRANASQLDRSVKWNGTPDLVLIVPEIVPVGGIDGVNSAPWHRLAARWARRRPGHDRRWLSLTPEGYTQAITQPLKPTGRVSRTTAAAIPGHALSVSF